MAKKKSERATARAVQKRCAFLLWDFVSRAKLEPFVEAQVMTGVGSATIRTGHIRFINDQEVKVVASISVKQRRPYTEVDVYLSAFGLKGFSFGFAKVCQPDEWLPESGVGMAGIKAVTYIVRAMPLVWASNVVDLLSS